MRTVVGAIWPVLLVPAVIGILGSAPLHAQGCEPIRFITPIDLGGQGQAYQAKGQLRLTLAYRRLHSDQWFVGTDQHPELSPGGVPPVFDVHTFIADAAYSISDHVRLRLSVPFSTGTLTRIWADSLHHSQKASGFG